jgi:hypothetical protein
MKNATRYRKTTTGLISLAAIALILGRSLYLYKLEEILICWLFFSAAFVSLALVILAGLFVFYVGECIIHWASTSPRVISAVALRPSETYSGIIPAEIEVSFSMALPRVTSCPNLKAQKSSSTDGGRKELDYQRHNATDGFL